MSAPITVLTVTVPGREALLAENIASVYAQTVPVERHLIEAHGITDEQPQVQYTKAKNAMLPAVTTPWIAVLNDDDTWLPHHVETVLPYLKNVDVVYTWDAGGNKPRENCNDWSSEKLIETFGKTNFIDGNCLIRRGALERVGRFPVDWVGPGPWEGGHYAGTIARWEDWALWQRLSGIGARFRCVPVETWRFGVGTPGQLAG